jgi:hypothetical protein
MQKDRVDPIWPVRLRSPRSIAPARVRWTSEDLGSERLLTETSRFVMAP